MLNTLVFGCLRMAIGETLGDKPAILRVTMCILSWNFLSIHFRLPLRLSAFTCRMERPFNLASIQSRGMSTVLASGGSLSRTRAAICTGKSWGASIRAPLFNIGRRPFLILVSTEIEIELRERHIDAHVWALPDDGRPFSDRVCWNAFLRDLGSSFLHDL